MLCTHTQYIYLLHKERKLFILLIFILWCSHVFLGEFRTLSENTCLFPSQEVRNTQRRPLITVATTNRTLRPTSAAFCEGMREWRQSCPGDWHVVEWLVWFQLRPLYPRNTPDLQQFSQLISWEIATGAYPKPAESVAHFATQLV